LTELLSKLPIIHKTECLLNEMFGRPKIKQESCGQILLISQYRPSIPRNIGGQNRFSKCFRLEEDVRQALCKGKVENHVGPWVGGTHGLERDGWEPPGKGMKTFYLLPKSTCIILVKSGTGEDRANRWPQCINPLEEAKGLQISFHRPYSRREEEKDVLGATIRSPSEVERFLSHPAEGFRDHDDLSLMLRVSPRDPLHHLFALSDHRFRPFKDLGNDPPAIFHLAIEMDIRSPGRDDPRPSIPGPIRIQFRKQRSGTEGMVEVNEVWFKMEEHLLKDGDIDIFCGQDLYVMTLFDERSPPSFSG
jgi:hypothetical protein